MGGGPAGRRPSGKWPSPAENNLPHPSRTGSRIARRRTFRSPARSVARRASTVRESIPDRRTAAAAGPAGPDEHSPKRRNYRTWRPPCRAGERGRRPPGWQLRRCGTASRRGSSCESHSGLTNNTNRGRSVRQGRPMVGCVRGVSIECLYYGHSVSKSTHAAAPPRPLFGRLYGTGFWGTVAFCEWFA